MANEDAGAFQSCKAMWDLQKLIDRNTLKVFVKQRPALVNYQKAGLLTIFCSAAAAA